MNERIDYKLPRTILYASLVLFIFVTLPHLIGMFQIKQEYINLIVVIDSVILGAFLTSLIYSIYAIVHNTLFEMRQGKNG